MVVSKRLQALCIFSAFGSLCPPSVNAQQAVALAPPEFEVASVRPSGPIPLTGAYGLPRGGPGTPDPGRITWPYATLKTLLMAAYDVNIYQVNGPAWLDTERYDIVANVSAGATKEQVGVMWQNLLAERFGMRLHHESREFRVEELVVAKGGPKLKETAENPGAPELPPAVPPPDPPRRDKNGFPELSGPGMIHVMTLGPNGPIAHTIAKAQPLSTLTNILGAQLKRPVLDKTGLTGKYDFTLVYTPDFRGLPLPPPSPGQPGPGPAGARPGDDVGESGPDFAAAVQEQLGLRLVASKAKLDVVVIDKAEKVPTDN